MKKALVSAALLTIAGLTMSALPIAQGATKPTSVPGCKSPTSKAHAPAKVTEPMTVSKSLPTTMTIETNCGTIEISLLTKKAGLTVTKLSALAKAKYFDGTFCHRLTTSGISVLQCGDPSASGGGGPKGWKGFKDENLPTNASDYYPVGTVAMANSGPNTNGSQFFLVFGPSTFTPDYTIWGKVTKGLDLLKKIGDVGAYKVNPTDNKAYYATDGYPIQVVEIKKITVK